MMFLITYRLPNGKIYRKYCPSIARAHDYMDWVNNFHADWNFIGCANVDTTLSHMFPASRDTV